MNILFYHPTSHSDGFPEPNLGLGYLMGVARRHGCRYALYDQDHHEKSEALEDVVRRVQPDLIAISFMTPQLHLAAKTMRQLKAWAPGARTIVGGAHCSALPEQTMAEIPEADFLARGEGEKTFAELLEHLAGSRRVDEIDGLYFRRGGAVAANRERALMRDEELDDHDVDWDELMRHGPYRQKLIYLDTVAPAAAFITARGCPFRCTFCDEGNIWRGRTRKRTIAKVVEEIRYLRDRFRITHFNVLDDTFSLDRRRVKEFCDRVAPLGVQFRITATIRQVTGEMLADLERAGCRSVAYGVESGDQAVLDRMNKRQTVTDIKRAFALMRQTKMRSYALCMVGNLGEDMAAVRRTAKLMDEIKPDFFSTAIMTPYPGSANWDICKANGWILHYDWQHWVPSVLKTKGYKLVSRTDVMDERQLLEAYFYMNRRVLLNRFRRKYGRRFPLRLRFYRDEVLPRLRTIGVGPFVRYLTRLGSAGGWWRRRGEPRARPGADGAGKPAE